jgi:CRP/FNR family transcriptional regulator
VRGISADGLPTSFTSTNCPTAKQCGDCSARHVGPCGALQDSDLGALANVAQRISVPAGKIFIAEGDAARFLYDIRQGQARVYKSLRDGRRQITGFMGVGHFLGLAVNGKYAFTAEAMDEVRLCRFERVAVKAVFEAFPALERRMLEVATHELAVAQEQMLLLGRKSARERVAGFLVSWAEKSGGDGLEPVTVALPMSRLDMADYLGLTLETVSRSFSQLKREGLVAFTDAREVTLLKRGRMQMIDAGEA